MNYTNFIKGLQKAIIRGLKKDDEGDVVLNIEEVADSVVDYLEQQGLITFTKEN